MRVDKTGSNRTENVKAKKQAGKSGDSGFADQLGGTQGAGGSGAVTGASPAGAADALLALQEVGDSTQGRAQAHKRGQELLDRLEELRDFLLLGAIPKDKLDQMAEILEGERARTDDPQMEEVLEEIDLRVQVELAKYHSQAVS